MAAERMYKKLPAPGVRVGTTSNLFLGPDHLLKTQLSGWVEKYKRFYYVDIQAVVIERTRVYDLVLVVTGMVLVVGILLYLPLMTSAVSSSRDPEALAFGFGAFVLFGVLPFTLNLFMGPTCRVVLRTAVHEEALPSLTRIRAARKAIALLTPRIEAAQKDLEIEPLRVTPTQPGDAVSGGQPAATAKTSIIPEGQGSATVASDTQSLPPVPEERAPAAESYVGEPSAPAPSAPGPSTPSAPEPTAPTAPTAPSAPDPGQSA